MGWSVESPSKRVEEEKLGKESDCRIRGRKPVWVRGLCLGFSLCAAFPQVLLLWLEAEGGLVKELFKTSRAVAECWLMSYWLIAPSSRELLSSLSQRKGWIILQQLPLQHLGFTRAASGSLGAAQPPQPPKARAAPTVQHLDVSRDLLVPECRLGATNSCSGPDSSFGSLQHGQPSVLQLPVPLLMSQAVHYPWLK